jgi:hypothetical protein
LRLPIILETTKQNLEVNNNKASRLQLDITLKNDVKAYLSKGLDTRGSW